MNTQDKLELFRESLYAISDEDFLALFEEIDSQTQEGQLSMEEYFDEINKTILVNEKIIFENKQSEYHISENSTKNNPFTQINTILVAA